MRSNVKKMIITTPNVSMQQYQVSYSLLYLCNCSDSALQKLKSFSICCFKREATIPANANAKCS